jgi:hypothetical protein
MVYSILSTRLFPLWPDRADVQCVFHYDTQARAIRCLHLQQQLLCWSPDTHTLCPLSPLLYLSFPSGYFMVLSSPMAFIPPRLMFCSHKYKSRSPRNAMTLIWSKPFLAAILFASQRVGDRQGPLDFQHVDRLATSIPVCFTFFPPPQQTLSLGKLPACVWTDRLCLPKASTNSLWTQLWLLDGAAELASWVKDYLLYWQDGPVTGLNNGNTCSQRWNARAGEIRWDHSSQWKGRYACEHFCRNATCPIIISAFVTT